MVETVDTSSNAELAAALGNLAVEMQDQADTGAVLRTLVASAGDIVPGIRWAGISMVRGKIVSPEAPTDVVAQTLDRLQTELGEGPAVDALADHHTITIADLGTETRWPRFVKAATDRGVHCLASFRLFTKGGDLGALTLYGPEPNVFDDDTVLIGEILAQHAAVAMAGANAEEHLRRAVASRDIIGQAKGLLMHREKVTALEAFAALVKASQDTNVKLVDVARFVVSRFEKGLDRGGQSSG